MLSAVLNQTDKALLVVNRQARIKIVNQQAEQLLQSHSCLQQVQQNLVLQPNIMQKRLQQLIDDSINSNTPSDEQQYLVINSTEETLCLAVVSLTHLDLHEPVCLLTINGQAQPGWDGFRAEFALTRREQELVQALYNGSKLTELTEQMAISYNTLRRHLQAVFKKCRVNSQSELMLLLNRFRY